MGKYHAILIIILWSAINAAAASFSPNDIEWASPVSGTLYKGGTLTAGEYMVRAVQFASPVQGYKDINGKVVPETPVEPSVLLEIYKNGVLIKEIIMGLQSEPYIDPDYEVKVSASEFTSRNATEWVFEFYNPWATISIQPRGQPELEVTVTTDKTEYTSYSAQVITAKVEIKNSGEAKAKNVDVNLNIGELKLRGGGIAQLHQYYYQVEKGMSQNFEVILDVPELIDQKSYTMSADSKGYDVKGIEYNATTSASVAVSPKQNFITISKAVRDRMYLQNTATVTITVSNGGMYDVYNLHVTDSMNENFELKSDASFQWDISVLKPGQEWGTTYSIKPLEANLNGFTIPAASAQFRVNNKQYSISSNAPAVVVNGPKIILNKTVDKPVVNISEDVTVTLSLNNIGNIATRAEVTDSLPDGVSLVSGPISIPPIFLELNAPNGTSYIIRMNREGTVELPAAVANYTGVEYRGTTRSVLSSQRPVISVIDPSKITPGHTDTQALTETAAPITQETTEATSPADTLLPTPTPITPGFGIVLGFIVLLFAAACGRK